MSPEYFKHSLRPYEAEAYLRGIEARERKEWERTRMQGYWSVSPWAKDLTPAKLLPFPWEKPEAPTREEIDDVRRWAEALTNQLNNNGKQRHSSES